MKLFINDIPVEIIRSNHEIDEKKFDLVIDGNAKPTLNISALDRKVLVKHGSLVQIEQVFRWMKEKKLKKLEHFVFAVDDPESVVHFLKEQFKIIKAGGGIVYKNSKTLMIYRLSKWDLPKGKLEKKESVAEGAVREVEEECSIQVKLEKKICSTWHTYTRNGKRILKKTTWYKMKCLDDSRIKPQIEEDIEEIKWMSKKEVKEALTLSYRSIKEVFDKYYEKQAVSD